MARAGRGGERRRGPLRVAGLLGALLAVYYLVPLAVLVVAEPPGAVLAALSDPAVRAAAVTSLLGAAGSVALATALGLPLAYWLARGEGPLRTLVTAVVLVPLVVPPVVAGVLLLLAFGPQGPLAPVLEGLGVRVPNTLLGTVLAQTFVASPFVVVVGRAAFAGVDRDLERASLSLGRGRLHTLLRVTLPLAWPGILAGVVLAFARSLGEFGATLTVAFYPRTLPVTIWDEFEAGGLDLALPVAAVLVAVALGALLVVTAAGARPWSEGRP